MNPTLTDNVGATEDETVPESSSANKVAAEGTCGISEQCQDKKEKIQVVEEESNENHVTEETREIAEKGDRICNIVDDTRTSVEMESVEEANVKVKGEETLMEERIFEQIEASETQQVSAEEYPKLTEEGKNGLEKNGRQETNKEKRVGLNSSEKVISSLEAVSGQKHEALFYADVEVNNLSTTHQTAEASQKKESIPSIADTTLENFGEKGLKEVEEKKSECCSLSMGEESSPKEHNEEHCHGENDEVTVTTEENTENAPNPRENLEETILPQHELDKTELEKCDRTCNIVDDTRTSVEMESIEKENLKVKEEENLMEETIIKQIEASENRQSSAEENPKLAAKEKEGFEKNAREENNKEKIAEFDSSEQVLSITEVASRQKDEALFYAPDMAVNNLGSGVETQDNFGEKGFEEVEDKKSDCCSTLMDNEKSSNEFKEEHGHVENEHTLVEDKDSITDKMTLIAEENNEKAPNHPENLEEILLQHEPEKLKLDNHSNMDSMDIDTSSKEYFEKVACIEDNAPIQIHNESFEGRAVADKSTTSDALGNLAIQEEKKILHTEFDNVEIEPQRKNANDVLLSHLIVKDLIQPEDEKREKVLVVQEEQTHEATEASREEEKKIEDASRAPRSTETTVLEHSAAGTLMTEDIQQASEASDTNKGFENVVVGAEDLERTYGLNPTEKIDGNVVKENMEGETNKEDAEEIVMQMHKEFKKNMADDDVEKKILEGKNQLAELTAVEVTEAAISVPISNEEMNQIASSHQVNHVAQNTSGSEQVRKWDMDEGRAIDNFQLPAKETDKLVHLEEEKEKQKKEEVQDLDSENKEKVQAKELEDNMRAETLNDREELNNDDHPMNTSKAFKEETVPKEVDGSLVGISREPQMSVEESKEDFLTKEKPSIHEFGSIYVFKVLEEASLNETEPKDIKQLESDGLACQEKPKDAKRARLDSLDIIVRTDDAYNIEENRNKDREEVDEHEEKIEQEIHTEAPTAGSEDQDVEATSEQSEAQDNLSKIEKELVRDEASNKVDETPVHAQIPYDNTDTSFIGQMAVNMNETEDSKLGTAFARKVRANNEMQTHQGDDHYEKHSSSSEDAEISKREKPTNPTDICKSRTSNEEKPLNEGSGVDKLEDKKTLEESGDNKKAILQQVDSGMVYEGPAAENVLVEQEAGTDSPRIEAGNTENYGTLVEENFKSAESSEEPKCTLGIVTKNQSQDTIPLTSESQEEIKRNDIHNQSFTSTEEQNSGETLQEDQNNKEEKTVTDVLPEDHSHSIENAYDVNKAVNITKELEGIKKDNDDENIRHQKEEGSNIKELLPVSTEEERTNKVKDYSPVSTEYFIAEHSNEETEKANFKAKGESTGKTEAAITDEMDEGKVEEEEEDREKPVSVSSVVAEESEEKNKKESTDEANKSYDKINTTAAMVMAQTSLEKSQIHKKPEVSNIFLDKRISCIVETEPSQQGNLTDSTSPEELTSSLVSQPPTAYHEDSENTETTRNPDAGEEPHETMKSLLLEKFHLDEARKAIKETSEMVYAFQNSQDNKAVKGNAIVADLNLTAEDLNQQLQTLSPTSPLKEQNHEIIETIKNTQGVQTTEYESSEKPLATKTAEETCLNKKDLHSSNFSQSGYKLNTETENDCPKKLNEAGRTQDEIREENKNDSEKEVKSEIEGNEAATDDEHRADQTHNVENLKEQHQAPPQALLFEGQKHGLTGTIENSKKVESLQDGEEMSSDEIYEGNTAAYEMVSTSDSQDIKAANTMDSPARQKSEEHQAALFAMHSQEQEHESSTIIESMEKTMKEMEVLKDEGTVYEISAKTKEASATIFESESQKLREHEAEIASDQTTTKEKLEEHQQMPHFALPSKEQVHEILMPIKSVNENVNAVELLADESQENSSAPWSAEKICLQEEETGELEVANLGHDITTDMSDDSSEAHGIKRDIAQEASKLEPQEYENEIDYIECQSENKKTTGLEESSENVSMLMSETSAKSLEHVSEVYHHEVSAKQDAEMKENLPETPITDLWAEENQCKKTVEATKSIQNAIANQKISEEGEDTNNHLLITLSQERIQESHQDYEHKAEEKSGETNKRLKASMSKTQTEELCEEAKKIDTTSKIGQKGDEEKTIEDPDHVNIQNEQIKKGLLSESKTGIQDSPNEVSEVKSSSLEQVLKLDDNEIKTSECPSESEKATALERLSDKDALFNPEMTSEENFECESEVQCHEVLVKLLNTMEEHPEARVEVLRAEVNQCNQTIESTQIIQYEATNEKEKADASNCHPISLTKQQSEGSCQKIKQKAQERETEETSMRNTGSNEFYEKTEKVDPTKKIEGEDGAEEKTVEYPDQVDIDNKTIKESIPSIEQVHRITSIVVNMNVEAIDEDRRPENSSATKTAEETCSRKERPKESEISCLGLASNEDNWEGSPNEVNKEVRTLDGTEEENKEDYEMASTMDSQDIRAATAIQSLPMEKLEEQHQHTYPEMLSEEQEHESSTSFGRQENNIKEMKLSTDESPENSASKTTEEAPLLKEETEEPKFPQMSHELDTIDKDSTNEVLKEEEDDFEEISEDIEEASARVPASKTQRLRGDEAEGTSEAQTLAVQELKEKTPSSPHSKEQDHGIIKKNEVEGLQDESQENSWALRTTETTCLQEEQTKEAEVTKLILEIRTDVLENPTEINEIKKDNPEQALTSEPQEYINEIENIDCPSKSEKTIGHCNKVPNFMFETEKGIEHLPGVHYHEFVTKHKTETKEDHPEEGITDFKAGENQWKKTIEATEIVQNDITREKIREEKDVNNDHPISLVEERSEEYHQEYEHKTIVDLGEKTIADLGEKTCETCETSISINQSKELHGEIEKIITTKKLEGQDGAKREKVDDPDQVTIQDETIKESLPTEIKADIEDSPSEVCEVESKTPDATRKLVPHEYEEESKKTTAIARQSKEAAMPILETSKKKVECLSAAPSHVILIESKFTKMKEDCPEAEPTEVRTEESQHKKSIEETEIIQNEVQNAELYEESAKIGATKKTEGQDLTEVKTVEDQGQVDVQKNTLEHFFPSETEGNNVECSATEQKHKNEGNDTKSVSSKIEAATPTEKEPGAEMSQKDSNIKLAENEKNNQDIQQKRDNSLVMSEKQIQIEADTRPNSVFVASNEEKNIPQELEDQIAKIIQNAETGDSVAEYATAIDSEVERFVNGGNKIMDSSADEMSENSQPMDSDKISLILIESQSTKLKEECLEAEPTEVRTEVSQHEKSIEETEIIRNECQNAELYEEIAKTGATKKTEGQDLTEVKTVEEEGQGQVDVQKNTLEHSFSSETEGNNVKCSATEQKQENESNDKKSVSSKIEAETLTEKEPGAEISQKEGNIKLAENEKINQNIQQKKDDSLVVSEKQIQIEADSRPNSVFMTSNEKNIPLELDDQIAKTIQNAESGDFVAEYATAIDSEIEGLVSGGNKIMDSSADETSESSQPMDSATISLPDLQISKKEALQVAGHLTEEGGQVETKEEEQVEETKTDEEKDEEKRDSGPGSPIMVEASGDVDVKVTKKKSHNILSGIGSKVKHSISKVKKAITGKSSHPKHHQDEVQTQVVNN
ncbi:titin isoform X2 [Tripterygium wilfordii]|uniref:titin isoform X2 n=1 Tax=Tripterygium wilfordii TaxID=458696 RepID=UPI0018F7F0F5|nr:titin isoform X2 [Tripterygium wilfordii]